MMGDLGIRPHLNYSMRRQRSTVVMIIRWEECILGCHHELAQRARDLHSDWRWPLLRLAHQFDRVQVDYIPVLGIHLGDDLVGIALRFPALALKIQHLGMKGLGIPLPHYFQL